MGNNTGLQPAEKTRGGFSAENVKVKKREGKNGSESKARRKS